ncbi:hypothetical protein SKAU_G00341010 [Synaphobranchus kaupii]|uniref:Uncharacterized protein n=1 Tax=Synaphobranchus kaupii TaxID=118154 RepID=A0A9Q1EMY6_SYNKA|nr:hypothetical protein SKAU_G00341010 [Synaphobranchus kaupii]
MWEACPSSALAISEPLYQHGGLLAASVRLSSLFQHVFRSYVSGVSAIRHAYAEERTQHSRSAVADLAAPLSPASSLSPDRRRLARASSRGPGSPAVARPESPFSGGRLRGKITRFPESFRKP